MAGVDVGLATDKDEKALAVLAEALGVTTLAAPVMEVLERRLLDVFAGNAPGMLIGGPPCTPFSHAGFWLEGKREGTDPDADLLDAYLEALRQLRPGAFVLENVPGLKFRTHHRFLDKLVSGASDVGYEVSSAVLNAAHFGVPQARRRGCPGAC